MNVFSNGINYADGETPTVMNTAIESIGYEGWYYKNSSFGKKISWYMPLGRTPFFILDFSTIYASLHIRNKKSLPFIVVYTAPIGFNDADKWYHSKTVYSVPDTVEIEDNANYCFFVKSGKMSDLDILGHTNIELIKNEEKSSGKFSATNIVKYVAFCTSDDAASGETEFILSDFNIIKQSGNIELFLSNNELFSSINVNFDSMVLSKTDNRKPGVSDSAFYNPLTVTKIEKTSSGLRFGHNGLFNDTIVDNFKLPRLANVAGKSESSVSNDNINTIFNNFFVSFDFSVETNVPNAQFTVETWGLDCATRTRVFIDAMGNIKIMYRGVDLFSNGNVLPNDVILDEKYNPTLYGWTTHVFPGSLIPGNWYRIVQTIHFSEELYGDKVNIRLYELNEDGNIIDIVLWDIVDNTWEAFYVNHPSQAANGNMPPSIDSIQIHCCDSPLNMNVALIKNIIYSTSKTIPVPSLDYLLPTEKGIITFLAGNSTGKSLTAITGLQYLFEASGGYQMDRGFDKIVKRTQDLIQTYDVTGSVQVKLSADLFNRKLGVVKDASNINILSSTYDLSMDQFPTDSITISSTEFVNGLNVNNIISVGKYSTMYSDFISYVRKYFGYSGGFSSLFKAASEFDISGGIFDSNSFMDLISSGNRITANDINEVNVAPSMFYKMTRSNGKMYEENAQDFTGTIMGSASLNESIQKWGLGSLNAVSGNGVMTDKYIVPGAAGMTFSFWVNIQNNDSNQNQKLFSIGDVFNVSIRGMYLLYPFIQCTNGGFTSAVNLLYGFVCGTWNHISITVDPAGVWKFYLNGAHKQTFSIDSSKSFGYPSTETALQLQIGGSEGYYNDFLYYDRILSVSEVSELYSMYNYNNGSTISTWVKFSSLNEVPKTVWSFYDSVNESTLSLYATNTNYTVKMSVSDLSDAVFNVENVVPAINTWTHIAYVFDNGQKENTWSVYINNVPYSNTIDTNNKKLPYVSLLNTVNKIGMDASSGLNKMHGYVDDVSIYDSVLSASKINYIYNGSNTLSKVADYTFDVESLTNYSIANYASGSAVYDASITNLSLLTASGEKYGTGCLYFPSGPYTGEVALGKMDFPDQGEFSFSTWVKLSNINPSGALSTIFTMYSNNSLISLYADVGKYTFSILHTKAPIYVESIPIQNNNFSNTANTTISGLSYPYCRNGTYNVSTSSTGFTAGNSIYGFFNNTGSLISTGAIYSASDGSYNGNTNSILNSNTYDALNALNGMKLYSDSSPRYSFNSSALTVSYTNILGLDTNADGTRIVFFVGTTIYWATRNPATGSVGTVSSLSTNKLKVHSISLKSDGSRIFISANTPFGVYYSDWNGTTYSDIELISSTTAYGNSTNTYGNISSNADGTKLFLTAVNSFNLGLSQPMKNYIGVFNGTTYDFSEIDTANYYTWGSAITPDSSRIGFCGYDTSTSPTYVPLYFANWNGTGYDSKTEIDYSSIPRTSLIKINRMKFSTSGRTLFVAVIGGVTGNTNLFYARFNTNTGNYGTFYPLYYSAIPSGFPSGNVNASIAIRTIDDDTYEVFLNRYQVSTIHALTIQMAGAVVQGEYMQISLPYNLNLTNYFLNSRFANYMPKTFYVLGSTNGTTWDIVSYKTNVSIVDTGRISSRGVLYNISNKQFHKHFRLVVSQTNNTAAAYLFNMRMSGFVEESIDYEFDCTTAPVVDQWTYIAGTLSNNGINSTLKMRFNNASQTFTTDSNNVLLPAFGIDSSYNRVILGMDKLDSDVTYNLVVLGMDKTDNMNEYYNQWGEPGTFTYINQWDSSQPNYNPAFVSQIFGAVEYINKMNGYIDGIQFFNSALSVSQLDSLYYNSPLIETSVAKYNFNTETVVDNQFANYASGTPVYDSSLTNLSLISSTGQRSGSGALYFPNTDYSGTVSLGNFSYGNPIDVSRNGAVWNYKFDMSQNDTGFIYDSATGSYNMNNGTSVNTITSERSAITGQKSLKANGGTTAVYYGGNPIYTIPQYSALTFAFWLYINPNTNNNGKGVIGMSNSNGSNAISVKISGTNTFYLSLQTTFGGTTTTNTPLRPIEPEVWTYVVWTITADGTWKLYLNGQLKETITANVKPFFSATHLYAASARGTTGFYGYLDEYRYYERELSSSEISSQYNFYTVDPNAVFTSDLSGSITISNINNLLRNAVDANVFGNRTPGRDASGTYIDGSGNAQDPVYKNNYGVNDGFLDGDIIWVPAGTTVKLSVGIDVESFFPLNNIGPSISSAFMNAQDTSWGQGNFLQNTIASTTKISRTIKAPLMIRVSNV